MHICVYVPENLRKSPVSHGETLHAAQVPGLLAAAALRLRELSDLECQRGPSGTVGGVLYLQNHGFQ